MPWTKPYIPPRNERLAPELYCAAHRIYFITIRGYRRQRPFVQARLCQMVVDTLRAEQERQACHVFTYCLMPDHLHFLVGPQRDGVSVLTFTDQFKGKTTNLSWAMNWQGKLWQPRYHDHIVRDRTAILTIAEYILANPVRQGLVSEWDQWPWSGHMVPLPD